MKKFSLILLTGMTLLLSSCNNTNVSSHSSSNFSTTSSIQSPSSSIDNNISNPYSQPTSNGVQTPSTNIDNLTPEDLTYLDLFDINNIISFDIDISSAELIKIQDDFYHYRELNGKSPIYRRANKVKITITKQNKDFVFEYNDVGVRMKGNTSRRDFINDSGDIYAMIHLKLSFEETFDDPMFYTEAERLIWDDPLKKEEREDRKFLDMSKLDLRYNKQYDQAHIKEYYALEMFRAHGIMTQRSNFSKVNIHQDGKTTKMGVFLVTEHLSKTFIKRALDQEHNYINMGSWDEEKEGTFGIPDEKYGQLYKASYGLNAGAGIPNMTYINDNIVGAESEDTLNCPVYELKTNEDAEGANDQMKNFINVINSQNEDKISEVIDLKHFAMYEAIATFLGSPDDLRNNYNNYSLYFRRTDGKMIVIPIDQDRVLGSSKDWDPTGHALSNTSPFSSKAEGASQDQVNPLYKKTILNKNSNTYQLYKKALQTILDSIWTTEEHFNYIYEIVKNNYENYEKEAFHNVNYALDEKYNGSSSNMSFKEYLSKKERTIKNALNQTSNEPGQENPSPSTSLSQEEPINLIEGCSEFYFRYTHNWDICDKNNLFYKASDTVYQYDYEITSRDIDNLKFKVFAAELGTSGHWLRAEENGGMLVRHGDDIYLNPSQEYLGQILSIVVDTSIGNVSWSYHN